MSSKSTSRRDPELPLFDLPLQDEGDGEQVDVEAPEPPADDPRERSADPPENLVLFDESEDEMPSEEPPESDPESDDESDLPGAGDRLIAGLADLGVQILALGAGLLGAFWLGARIELSSWPAFVGLGLSFSFLYWVVPLAFWGRTPGMAWLGHVARAEGDQPLTFGQAGWRWVGALVTLGLAGLPQLLLLGDRSLGDLLSSSRVQSDYQAQR